MEERVRKRIKMLCIAAAILAIGIVATLLAYSKWNRSQGAVPSGSGSAVSEEERLLRDSDDIELIKPEQGDYFRAR
jgi:hypothetical protein